MFSGQGAQYLGMGKEVREQYALANNYYKKADQELGFSITNIIDNNQEDLNATEYAQPAIFTTSVALCEVLKSKGVKADYVLGLSLGEYAALYESGILSFEDGVKLVNRRGKYMASVVPRGQGSMAAILGMDADALEEVCASVNGICSIANYNCPGQLVIGGEKQAVLDAMELAKAKGAKRAIELNVAGPFHTKMLEKAGSLLFEDLYNVTLHNRNKEIVMNVTGDLLNNADNIKDLMRQQVSKSVLFEKSIRRLIDLGVDTFIEIGPGKVLCGFVKKIDDTKTILNVENLESLDNTLKAMGL